MDGGKQEMNTKGRVTIPTDMDAVPETLDLLKRWAGAHRTEFDVRHPSSR